jgi:hypothetical protein
MKSISICDMFYWVTFDTTRPLPKMTSGNKYVLIVTNHNSKWCEAHLVKSHDAMTTTQSLEEQIICWFGVFKYIFIDNGNEWMEFDVLCQDYEIIYQFIALAWP